MAVLAVPLPTGKILMYSIKCFFVDTTEIFEIKALNIQINTGTINSTWYTESLYQQFIFFIYFDSLERSTF